MSSGAPQDQLDRVQALIETLSSLTLIRKSHILGRPRPKDIIAEFLGEDQDQQEDQQETDSWSQTSYQRDIDNLSLLVDELTDYLSIGGAVAESIRSALLSHFEDTKDLHTDTPVQELLAQGFDWSGWFHDGPVLSRQVAALDEALEKTAIPFVPRIK